MWKTLSKIEAEKEFNNWHEEEIPEPSCDEKYMNIRKSLTEKYNNIIYSLKENSISSKQNYILDVKIGLELYEMLWKDYNFHPRDASDDGVWIHLSVKVVPDLVYDRWGMKATRFYKQNRRIWLKTLWWYIHLSWAGSKNRTYNILKDFNTDVIVQLVERSGPFGYRINLTREIMRQFSNIEHGNIKRNLFRKVMKLNTARMKLMEPELAEGGTQNYAKELLEYFYDDYAEEK